LIQTIAEALLRDLDDKNDLDATAKRKICDFCAKPGVVTMTRTAERDAGLVAITKAGVLEGILLHIQSGKRVCSDRMDNGDLAYIFHDCGIEQTSLYVKVKFSGAERDERMIVVSAHPDRRW
jgi:hypothetical protein